jgi:hypothetical protein
LACAISSPLSLMFLLCSDRLIVLVIAGFLIAAAVRASVPVCLATKKRLWHTRWPAPVLMLVVLVAINITLRVADRLALQVLGTGPFLSSAAAPYVLIALELIWIALLY